MKLGQFSDEAISAVKQLLADSIEFSELETMDFTRCQRPDGSFYGTGGQCRKGGEVQVVCSALSSGTYKNCDGAENFVRGVVATAGVQIAEERGWEGES
jgi:hypothetical protein